MVVISYIHLIYLFTINCCNTFVSLILRKNEKSKNKINTIIVIMTNVTRFG